jgi:hypothetical protein
VVVGQSSSGQNIWYATGSSRAGYTWNPATTQPFTSIGYCVAYGMGLFVAGGSYTASSCVAWSTDGNTWTLGTGTFSVNTPSCVAYDGNTWTLGSNTGFPIMISTDGKSWSIPSIPPGYGSSIYSIDFDGSGNWVSVGANIYVSNDSGDTWTNKLSGFFSKVLRNGSTWVAIPLNSSTDIYYSTDTGNTWTLATGDTFGSGGFGRSIYYKNKWVTCGHGSNPVLYSNDGMIWKAATGDLPTNCYSVMCNAQSSQWEVVGTGTYQIAYSI